MSMSFGQRRADALHLVAQPVRDLDLVRADQRPDRQGRHASFSLYFATMSASSAPSSTRATSLSRTIAPFAVGDDQVLELLGRAQVGVREQVDLHQVAFRSARRPPGSCCAGGPPARRRAKGSARRGDRGRSRRAWRSAAALEGHPLDTGQRRELRLQRAQQPIRDGRHAALRGGEAEIE